MLITTQSQLDNLCFLLSGEEVVAIDTEFVRRDTYYSKLSLIQIATKTNTTIIDTLGLNLEPFKTLLLDETTLKIFHAPRQDFELFYHLFGIVPVNVFDTQIAAGFCGLRSVMSYADLCSEVCHVTIDKTYQAANWLARPIKDDMLTYAAKDVEYLHDLHEYLNPLINDVEKYKARVDAETLDPKLYQLNFQNAWKKIRVGTRSEEFVERMKELAAFREEIASNLDVPRGHFIPDSALIQICSQLPTSARAFGKIKWQTRWMKMEKYQDKIMDLCAALAEA